ncbi:conserved hypothetical protein [Rhodopseudomonas palustris HaA2]|uniref:DUF3325 domain-containing protein n=1 Tax=Rhodopseudomonas palustris (strain HaA2) TaxID=316058 RepID=Q2IU92_RHOP2|nr:DUF3325 domain-containing protein [Rhodopseudomonas palustris]ABD08218.1 conserved hypothetical protein [Rhodopseudomonas palustris HaA2]
MMHALAFTLCLIGFAALALATRRQQHDVIGRSLPRGPVRGLRIVGTIALLLALGWLVARQGFGLGLVMFSGHTTMAAAVVYGALIARVRMAGRTARRR